MKARIIKALQQATEVKDIQLEFPESEDFGDYATNLAMVLAKKKGKKPREYAEEVVEKLQKDRNLAKITSKIEFAGPGFINFYLSSDYLARELARVLKKGDRYGSANIGKGKTVLVEYSSPNIAKYFGIGHLRSTIIGQALYNLYKFLGYKVVGDNHIGDWGTQFGMIIAQVKRKNLDIEKLSVEDLERIYVDFNKEAEKKPELKDEARNWFKKLEQGDKEARHIWKKAKETSLKEFARIYRLLGVEIDHQYGESFYEDKIPAIIKQVAKRGLAKKSKGAEIVEFEEMPPAMLLKSDGATTYFTRDLATVKFRIKEWNPKILIYEVGADQTLHFRQVFETARLLGWTKGCEFVHVAHGLLRFKHGKMSTRRGETVRLEDVLEESVERARKIINKSKTGRDLSKKEKNKISEAVGIGAVKYFDLMHQPTSDIIFDWEKMFVLEGNSAPYLQYTFARAQSVLAKAKAKGLVSKGWTLGSKNWTFNREELSALRALIRFPEVVVRVAENYSPNLLCNYLFDLAQKFNHFYNVHRIIGGKEQGKRLALTKAVGQILKNGLEPLGIRVTERM
jgi:arginyl-tRNA synthetase